MLARGVFYGFRVQRNKPRGNVIEYVSMGEGGGLNRSPLRSRGFHGQRKGGRQELVKGHGRSDWKNAGVAERQGGRGGKKKKKGKEMVKKKKKKRKRGEKIGEGG